MHDVESSAPQGALFIFCTANYSAYALIRLKIEAQHLPHFSFIRPISA